MPVCKVKKRAVSQNTSPPVLSLLVHATLRVTCKTESRGLVEPTVLEVGRGT